MTSPQAPQLPMPSVSDTVHISMTVDGGFEMPLAVSLLSLAEAHHRRGTPCEVSVLCTGLANDVRARIERDVAGRIGIDWVDVDLRLLAGANYPTWLSAASLFRFLLPELLPASRTRTIYLDADTLVLDSFAELWRTDLDGHLLAAVRDAGAPFAAGPLGTDWRSLGLAPDAEYFNAGLLVMPLDTWRREGTDKTALALLREKKLQWGDQDALNVVAQGRWREVPRRWNLQTIDAEERGLAWAMYRSEVEDAVAKPAMVHYTGPVKPWAGRTDHPFAAQWFATLERSSWAGFGPEDVTVVTRARRRIARAAQVLRYG